MKSARLEAILERDDLEILRDMQAKVQVFLCDRVIANFLERRVMPRDIPSKIEADLTSRRLKIAKGRKVSLTPSPGQVLTGGLR